MSKAPRYLIYSIDKNQSSPRFSGWAFFDPDPQSCEVVVDLWRGRRWWAGAWAKVDGFRDAAGCPSRPLR